MQALANIRFREWTEALLTLRTESSAVLIVETALLYWQCGELASVIISTPIHCTPVAVVTFSRRISIGGHIATTRVCIGGGTLGTIGGTYRNITGVDLGRTVTDRMAAARDGIVTTGMKSFITHIHSAIVSIVAFRSGKTALVEWFAHLHTVVGLTIPIVAKVG